VRIVLNDVRAVFIVRIRKKGPTVLPDKAKIAEGFDAIAIDYRTLSLEEYVALHTAGQGFDIVYDTVGAAALGASFAAVKALYRREATYSGVFTLLPLITERA
jgi:NADPH2:quinone reductase